ncbi:macrophage mannose receptor 1-like isoform X3 [Triplophysa dalaica]|uniref:macrophage mannose receptor 1-like isoform X3 n=1 Tax=Triplophysa dalaica TaxID=1582913 RepID=UPI0024DFB8D4|nr:macrophage mannose receptor 1-like isoform X3 [Triplophysa dalaica]
MKSMLLCAVMQKHQRGAMRAVMDMSLFVLLLLSGLMCSTSGLWRQYHYINRSISWAEAQSYCRERFTDLATVDSIDDVNRMMNTVNDGYSGSVWIGLKRATQKRLGWSMGDDTLTQYSPWQLGYPKEGGECFMFRDKVWRDYPCAGILHFVCYDNAQSYCRQYHTDLATISSPEEQNQIFTAVGSVPWLWIGLFSDSWLWSDQWSLFFRNWAAGQHFQSFGDCVAMSTADSGKWTQYSCDQQHPFICYGEDKQVNKQIVRLKLSHDWKNYLSDPRIQTTILNEINKKLESMGMEDCKSISWRKDEGREIFHLMNTTVKSSKPCD